MEEEEEQDVGEVFPNWTPTLRAPAHRTGDAWSSDLVSIDVIRDDNSVTQHQLDTFECASAHVSGSQWLHEDVVCNVGGAPWALDWCPFREGRTTYLAVGTRPPEVGPAFIGGREEHRSCVQIWQVTAPANAGERAQKRSKAEPAPEAAGDDAEETPASLCFVLEHNAGSVWDVHWRPLDRASAKAEAEATSTLGLLAVCASDGMIHIVSVPSVSDVHAHASASGGDDGAQPARIELVPSWSGTMAPGHKGRPCSVEWHPAAPHDRIAAAFHDGSVAIWLLSGAASRSALAAAASAAPPDFPLVQISSSHFPLRQVCWAPAALSPHCDSLLACTGDDGQLSFWDYTDPAEPIMRWKAESSFGYGLRWCAEPPCVAAVFDVGKCIIHRGNLRNLGPESAPKVTRGYDWNIFSDPRGAALWGLDLLQLRDNGLLCYGGLGGVVYGFLTDQFHKNKPKTECHILGQATFDRDLGVLSFQVQQPRMVQRAEERQDRNLKPEDLDAGAVLPVEQTVTRCRWRPASIAVDGEKCWWLATGVQAGVVRLQLYQPPAAAV